jgi:hypothetical protein
VRASYAAARCAKISICYTQWIDASERAYSKKGYLNPDYARRVAKNGTRWTVGLAVGEQRQATEASVGGVSMHAYPSYQPNRSVPADHGSSSRYWGIGGVNSPDMEARGHHIESKHSSSRSWIRTTDWLPADWEEFGCCPPTRDSKCSAGRLGYRALISARCAIAIHATNPLHQVAEAVSCPPSRRHSEGPKPSCKVEDFDVTSDMA